MNEVLVRVKGQQIGEVAEEPIEIVTTGQHYFKNGKHFIFYEEVMEGLPKPTKNTIKIDETSQIITIKKQGIVQTNMVFEENKKNSFCYTTPFGDLAIDIKTDKVEFTSNEECMFLYILYSMDINYDFVSKNSICIDIKILQKK